MIGPSRTRIMAALADGLLGFALPTFVGSAAFCEFAGRGRGEEHSQEWLRCRVPKQKTRQRRRRFEKLQNFLA